MRPGRPRSRYSYPRCVENVQRLLARTATTQREAAGTLGVGEPAFSAKMRGVKSHFTVEELGALADLFSAKLGRPLTGAPFLDLEHAEMIDALIRGRGR